MKTEKGILSVQIIWNIFLVIQKISKKTSKDFVTELVNLIIENLLVGWLNRGPSWNMRIEIFQKTILENYFLSFFIKFYKIF